MTTAPSGRNRNPTPKVMKVLMSASASLPAGKKAWLIGTAKKP